MDPTCRPAFPTHGIPHRVLLAAAFGAALVAACAGTPSGSGFLGTYIDMKPNRYLEAESHLRGVSLRGGVLVVRRVRPYDLARSSRVSVERLGASFEEALVREIEASGLFTAVRKERDEGRDGDARWLLEAVITEIESGLPDASLMPGVSAPRAKRVEVEGKIVDARSRRVVLKFKDARAARGGLGSFGTTAEAEADLAQSLDAMARGVADTLRQIRAEGLKAPAPGDGPDVLREGAARGR